jgi:signal transduction histidine kinase
MAPDSWSWERRRIVALGINAAVAAASIATALFSWGAPSFEPLSLVLVLGAFAIACELLSVQVTYTLRDSVRPWFLATGAPYVLAVVFLGPIPALAIAAVSLQVAAIHDRNTVGNLIANFANYGAHIAVQGLLINLAFHELHVATDDALFPLVVALIYQFGATASLFYTATYDVLAYGDDWRLTLRNGWRLQIVADPPLAVATGLTAYLYATTGEASLTVLVSLQLVFIFLAREVVRSQERSLALERRSAELVALNDSRGRLVGQVLAAEESERRRLAEALHDEAMQNLLVARQDLGTMDATSDIERARRGIDATVDQLREAIFELHPAVLDHGGPVPAIEAIAERHARRSGFAVAIDSEGFARTQHDRLIFTVCRELLANVAAHAGAARVDIVLTSRPDAVVLEVHDDGCGLDRDLVDSALERGHIGLASTAERIDALRGSFNIQGRPGGGTSAQAIIPAGDSETAPATTRGARSGVLVPETVT